MNYAVITKARAMYGKRLTEPDFRQLTECRTVEDCAVFLKSHPAYSGAFENTSTRSIRLSQIELLLKREYCLEFERLVKGLSEKERRLAIMFIGTYELDFIMWALRNTEVGALEKAPAAQLYEPLIRKYFDSDFLKLSGAQSNSDVIAGLHGQYRSIIEKSVQADGKIDYLNAENELWKIYYGNFAQLIKKEFKKDDSEVLYGTSVDLYNIIRIFRLKEYFSYPPEEIFPFIIRPTYRLSDDTIAALCAGNGGKEFFAALGSTHYRQLKSCTSGEELEMAAAEIVREKSGKILHFSNSAPAVIYSYLKCKINEVEKIKTVIESVRYNLSREMIESYVGTKAKAN